MSGPQNMYQGGYNPQQQAGIRQQFPGGAAGPMGMMGTPQQQGKNYYRKLYSTL